MFRTLIVACCAIACVTLSRAQDKPEPAKIDIEYLGEPAGSALRGFAESARLKLDAPEELELETPVWLSAKKIEVWQAVRLLSVATGLSIAAENGRLTVRTSGSTGTPTTTRGYDVSVLAGRHVDYVNKYGEEGKPAAGTRKRTATEHLGDFIDIIARSFWADDVRVTAIGDRLLITAAGSTHLRLREFLDLMASETGGESGDLKREREHLKALRAQKGAYSAVERPLGSVVAELCREAKADFVMDAELAALVAEVHVTHGGDGTFEEHIKNAAAEHVGTVRVSGNRGAAFICVADAETGSSERVFECGELLKRVDAAFHRQHTQPEKRQGFEGSARDQGGIDLIGAAIHEHLDTQGIVPLVATYATRIVVGGGPDAADAAAQILKELGWEEPGN